MSIVNTTLHPEDDQTVDLYPKTSSEQVTDFLDKTYPVGSIYLSTVNTSPASLFGGTWTKIKDRFLLMDGDTYTAGQTGGNSTHYHVPDTTDPLRCSISIDSVGHMNYRQKSLSSGYNVQLNYEALLSISNITAVGSSRYIDLQGQTDSKSNLPPYLVVYCWYRIE